MSLTDEQKSKFLRLIASGHLRYESARAVQSSVPEVKRHLKADPEFASAFDDAQLEASEPVESVLYQAALNKEPWAVTKWLTARDKERWAEPTKAIEVKHSGSVALEPGQTAITAVAVLLEALRERQAIRTGEDTTFATIRAPKKASIEATATDRAAPPPAIIDPVAPEGADEPTPPAPPAALGMFAEPVLLPRPGA